MLINFKNKRIVPRKFGRKKEKLTILKISGKNYLLKYAKLQYVELIADWMTLNRTFVKLTMVVKKLSAIQKHKKAGNIEKGLGDLFNSMKRCN